MLGDTIGRGIFHDYIDRVRDHGDLKLRNDFFLAQCFMKKIDDLYNTLYSAAFRIVESGNDFNDIEDKLRNSICYCLIIFFYSILEILDEDFLKKHPLFILRSKLGHGGGILNYAPKRPKDYQGQEFNDLWGAERGNEKTIFSSILEIQKNDGSRYCEVDSETVDKNSGRVFDSSSARQKLKELLCGEEIYICSSGNYIIDIDKLYSLVCEKSETFLKNNL
jgi:hypothetical protein